MFQVPITNVPNQSLSFNADGSYWQLRISQAVNHMVIDITRDGNAIVTGQRCLIAQPLMPYSYQWSGFGNLVFDNDPDWNNFGTTCNLYYLSAQELSDFQDLLIFGTA